MNEIAAKLGEVGLPMPVTELAARRGTRSSSAAATTASPPPPTSRAPAVACSCWSARERLGGACTLERPFADERFTRQPLRLRRRPARRARDRRARPAPRAATSATSPTRTCGCRSRTARRSAQWLDDARTQREPRAARRLQARHRRLLGLRARSSTRSASGCAPARATPGRATRPPGEEIEELLHGEQTMLDVVFDASIAEVLDDYLADQRLKDALFGQGVIAAYGGPKDPGTAVDQAHALPGRPRGPGPRVGLRRGRHGDGLLRDRRRRPRRPARVLACGVPVAEIRPGRGRHARGRDLDPRPRRASATPTRRSRCGCSTARTSPRSTASGSRSGRSAHRS